MKDLQGKVAVVTGAASGIGRAMARRFAEQGMGVALADVETEALSQAHDEVAALGVRAVTVPTDVSDPEQVEILRERTLAELGGVHVVCNNAGVDSGAEVADIPLATWEWVLGVNLWGVIHGIRSFVPHLVAQGEGHVVNTSSIAAITAMPPTAAPYVASKSAVMGLTRNLRIELEARGVPVGVTLLMPGPVRTNMPTSERNRPAHVDAPPASALRDDVQDLIESLLVTVAVDPLQVADAVVDAVRENRSCVITDFEHVREALDALGAELLASSLSH